MSKASQRIQSNNCPLCFNKPKACMGYDFHKVSCSNEECVLSQTPFTVEQWANLASVSNLFVNTVHSLHAVSELYCDLVNSGDAGNWTPEEDEAIIKAHQNIKEFQEKYLCHWSVSSREQVLQERLQQYYLETPDSMSNADARIKRKEFQEWCQVMGYSDEEINKAKRARQYHMP